MSEDIPKPASQERINAKVVAHAKNNTVGLGLVSASDSRSRMSILLSPDDTMLLAERLIASAMKLDRPPTDKSMKQFLSRLLTAMQNK